MSSAFVPVIDVSHDQGSVDFVKMRANGVAGVILRAGDGSRADTMFDQYAAGAAAAGLPAGAYWFCNPKDGSANDQATLLAAAHTRHSLALPPMLDVEDYTHERGGLPVISGASLAAWLQTFATAVEAGARRPIIYSNAAYWDPHVGATTFGSYDVMVARYPFYSAAECKVHVPPTPADQWDTWIMAATPSRPIAPAGWATWQGWQFSAGYNGRGAVYGASSADIDLNIVHADVWARWLG